MGAGFSSIGKGFGGMSPASGASLGSGLFQIGAGLLGMGKSYMPSMEDPSAGLYGIQQKAYDNEAIAQEQQAMQAEYEAGLAAQQKAREVHMHRENQANTYSASGVTLDGSPMDVLNETRALGQQEVDAILKSGQASGELLRRKAMLTRNEGRAAILGSQIKFQTEAAANKISAIGSQRTPIVSGLKGLANLLPGASKSYNSFGNGTIP